MGRPMAKNLLKAGFPLVVHSRSQGPVDDLVAAGATRASSPADVARRAEAASAQDRVGRIYRAVLGRAPSQREVQMGIDYVGGTRDRWPLYAQALLNSNEFVFVD